MSDQRLREIESKCLILQEERNQNKVEAILIEAIQDEGRTLMKNNKALT